MGEEKLHGIFEVGSHFLGFVSFSLSCDWQNNRQNDDQYYHGDDTSEYDFFLEKILFRFRTLWKVGKTLWFPAIQSVNQFERRPYYARNQVWKGPRISKCIWFNMYMSEL